MKFITVSVIVSSEVLYIFRRKKDQVLNPNSLLLQRIFQFSEFKDLEILFPIFYIKELIKQILGMKPVAKTITNNYDQENINTKSEDWQLNCATLHIQQNWSGTNENFGEQNKFMMGVYTIFH